MVEWLLVAAVAWASIATLGWLNSIDRARVEIHRRVVADAERHKADRLREAAESERYRANRLCGEMSGRHARAVSTIELIRQQLAEHDQSEAMLAANPIDS